MSYASFLHYEQIYSILGEDFVKKISLAADDEKHRIYNTARKETGLTLRSTKRLTNLSAYYFIRVNTLSYYENYHGKEKVNKDLKEYIYR